MSLINIPPELVLLISENLAPGDLNAFLRTSQKFALLLQPCLRSLSLDPLYAPHALYYAAARNNSSMAQHLLEKGPEFTMYTSCSLMTHDGFGRSIYQWSDPISNVTDNPLSILPTVLQLGPSLVIYDKSSENPMPSLHWAVQNSQYRILGILLTAGADVRMRNYLGDTALHVAAKLRNPTATRMLLAAGADPNVKNIRGTAAAFCSRNLDEEPEVPDENEGEAPAEVAHLLFEAVDVNTRFYNTSAIHIAAKYHDLETVQILHRRGVKIFNGHGFNGMETVLISALKGRNHASAKFLVENGADPNQFSGSRLVPLGVALGKNYRPLEIVKFLVEKGADIHTGLKCGHYRVIPPVLLALVPFGKEGDEATVRWLLENGADASAVDAFGRTGLQLAVRIFEGKRQEVYVPMFLKHGCNVNIQDLIGRTALHYALMRQAPRSVLEMLLDGGADINIEDNEGLTPLQMAVRHSKHAVGMLLDHGAEVFDTQGKPRVSEKLRRHFSKAEWCSFVDKTLGNDQLRGTIITVNDQ